MKEKKVHKLHVFQGHNVEKCSGLIMYKQSLENNYFFIVKYNEYIIQGEGE